MAKSKHIVVEIMKDSPAMEVLSELRTMFRIQDVVAAAVIKFGTLSDSEKFSAIRAVSQTKKSRSG